MMHRRVWTPRQTRDRRAVSDKNDFDLQLGSRLKFTQHVFYIPATSERAETVYLERDTLNSGWAEGPVLFALNVATAIEAAGSEEVCHTTWLNP